MTRAIRRQVSSGRRVVPRFPIVLVADDLPLVSVAPGDTSGAVKFRDPGIHQLLQSGVWVWFNREAYALGYRQLTGTRLGSPCQRGMMLTWIRWSSHTGRPASVAGVNRTRDSAAFTWRSRSGVAAATTTDAVSARPAESTMNCV